MIQLEASDKNANLVGPRGERFLQKDGVVNIPDRYSQYADACAAPGTIFKHRARAYAGFDASELAENYRRWEEGRQ